MRSQKVSAELSHNAGVEVLPRRTGTGLFVFARGFSGSSVPSRQFTFVPETLSQQTVCKPERRMGTESIKSARGAKLTWVDGFRITPERSIGMTATRRSKQTNKSMDFFFLWWMIREILGKQTQGSFLSPRAPRCLQRSMSSGTATRDAV